VDRGNRAAFKEKFILSEMEGSSLSLLLPRREINIAGDSPGAANVAYIYTRDAVPFRSSSLRDSELKRRHAPPAFTLNS